MQTAVQLSAQARVIAAAAEGAIVVEAEAVAVVVSSLVAVETDEAHGKAFGFASFEGGPMASLRSHALKETRQALPLAVDGDGYEQQAAGDETAVDGSAPLVCEDVVDVDEIAEAAAGVGVAAAAVVVAVADVVGGVVVVVVVVAVVVVVVAVVVDVEDTAAVVAVVKFGRESVVDSKAERERFPQHRLQTCCSCMVMGRCLRRDASRSHYY